MTVVLGDSLPLLALICGVPWQAEERYSLVDCCAFWRQGIRSLALWGIAVFSTVRSGTMFRSMTRRFSSSVERIQPQTLI